MIGYNRVCAQYAGVRVGSGLVRAMAISGMLAGLAGVTYYLGYYNTIVPKELASMGYDSIAVSLLGNSSPAGCIFASFLITIFQKGQRLYELINRRRQRDRLRHHRHLAPVQRHRHLYQDDGETQ